MTLDKEDRVSDEELTEAARSVLSHAGTPLLAAKLGQHIARRFGQPLRAILGERKLSALLESQRNSGIEISGPKDALVARLIDLPNQETIDTNPKFDPQFWAGFSKPIPEGYDRFIRTSYPFRFDNFIAGTLSLPDRVQIFPTDIPDITLDKTSRDNAIKDSIAKWCERHGLDRSSFLMRQPRREKHVPPPPSAPKLDPRPNGVQAILSLIDAVPTNERSQYQLPLNLIEKLLR